MRRFLACGALIVALGCSAPAALSASLDDYSSFWVLGDSLSDDGSLFAATDGAIPPPPYWEGRFSNGPVWAEHVADDFGSLGKPTGNFAYGRAAVGAAAPPALSFGQQIEAMAAASEGLRGERPVAGLWIGANDLVGFGIPNGVARETGRAAALGVAAGVEALRGLGFRDVLLFNLPALERTPLYALGGDPAASEQARIGTRAFNATLKRAAKDLRDDGMNVMQVNAFKLLNQLLDDPEKYGVANATLPCLVPTTGQYCGPEAARLLAFFDPLHPNATIHGALADEARAKLAPVPLPAPALLLVAALGGLVAAARRRRQASAALRADAARA